MKMAARKSGNGFGISWSHFGRRAHPRKCFELLKRSVPRTKIANDYPIRSCKEGIGHIAILSKSLIFGSAAFCGIDAVSRQTRAKASRCVCRRKKGKRKPANAQPHTSHPRERKPTAGLALVCGRRCAGRRTVLSVKCLKLNWEGRNRLAAKSAFPGRRRRRGSA